MSPKEFCGGSQEISATSEALEILMALGAPGKPMENTKEKY